MGERIPVDSDRLIGRRLGRYLISSSLGRGGMAEVFQASDDRLNREVAVKVVLPIYGSEPQLLQRFLREARVVASLEHPNILPIYDFGEHDGLPFLVLPLIRGGTLADRVGARVLDPPRIAAWTHDLARALDAAHAAGVLHRDVKPGNVLVGRDEHLFLADFGIARLCDATRLTRTGTVVGTPVYMAPEVAAGHSAEAASDLYSLAVMSYEMLAGRPPFEGENVLSILHQHATRPVPPITGTVDLPAGVDRVLEQALAKQPAERPASCRAFAELLAEQLPGAVVATPLPVSDLVPTLEMTREPTVAPVAVAASGPPTSDAYGTLHAPSGAFLKLRQWGLAGVLGGLVAIAGFLALRGLERQPATASDAVEQSAAATPAAPDPVVDPPPAGPAESPPAASPPTEPTPAASTPAASTPAASTPAVSTPAVSTPAPPAVAPEPRPTPAASAEAPRPVDAGPVDPRPVDSGPVDPRPGSAQGPDRMRFNALRSFTSRLTEQDFHRAREAARRLPGHADQAEAMATWGRGGLAYLDGDEAGAARALHQALGDPRFVAFWGPSPLMLLASSDRQDFAPWELALAYGDPRGSAGATLDDLLSGHPENPRLRFARALVHRLDGEHGAVIRYAQPVFQQLGTGDAPEARGYLAQIIGDAYLGLDRGEEALEWFRRAFEAGGPFRGLAAMRAAEAAREMKRPDLMTDFLERACDADVQPACRRLRANPRKSRDRR